MTIVTEPSSSVAAGLKLAAVESVHPKTVHPVPKSKSADVPAPAPPEANTVPLTSVMSQETSVWNEPPSHVTV